MKHNIFTEEGRTRIRNFIGRLKGYLLLFFLLGLASGGVVWWIWTWEELRPLERAYFSPFLKASFKSKLPVRTQGKYTVLAYEVAGGRLGILNDDQVYIAKDGEGREVRGNIVIRDSEGRAVRSVVGYLFRGYTNVKLPPFQWRHAQFFDSDAERLFREGVYRTSFPGLFAPWLYVGLSRDMRKNRT